MPGFRDRLRRAIQAGSDAAQQRLADQRRAEQHEQKMRALYHKYEQQVRDYIENCLHELGQEWPGFKLAAVVGDKGLGSAISRDDRVRAAGGGRRRAYSRLEIVVRPYGKHHFLEVVAKGTIRNKERFHRGEDDRLETLDLGLFKKFIERIVLEYARGYAEGRPPGAR